MDPYPGVASIFVNVDDVSILKEIMGLIRSAIDNGLNSLSITGVGNFYVGIVPVRILDKICMSDIRMMKKFMTSPVSKRDLARIIDESSFVFAHTRYFQVSDSEVAG